MQTFLLFYPHNYALALHEAKIRIVGSPPKCDKFKFLSTKLHCQFSGFSVQKIAIGYLAQICPTHVTMPFHVHYLFQKLLDLLYVC